MNLPGVIIIGAQKCGTTSLHKYLNCHPEIIMSAQKELNFFCEDYQWVNGVEWYMRQFTGQAKIFGEASPGYTMYPVRQGTPERMSQVVPKAKLIYLVRDPVERMISHYLDRLKAGRERRPVDVALTDPSAENFYLRYSQYYEQLSLFLKYYPREAILVETAANLRNNRIETLRRIFLFLQVDPDFTSPEFQELQNVSNVKLQHRKPRRIVRKLLLDESSNYPRLKSWLAAGLPRKVHAGLIRVLVPGTRVARPQLTDAARHKIRQRLEPDLSRFRDLTGIDLLGSPVA